MPLVPPIRLAETRKREMRTQFGALCWRRRKSKTEILLVTSRRTRRWLIPKGWPMDGRTPAEAALQEAWEEAGIVGRSDERCIGIYTYTKVMEVGDDLPCAVAIYPVRVAKVSDDWPEKDQRMRRWVSQKKAAQMVDEPELKRLILDFDPKRL